jgi:hypothetical protein
MSHINIRCKSIPLQFVCPLLDEQIAICQLQPTDHSRAKYGAPFYMHITFVHSSDL